VASLEALLKKDRGDLWDSGKVASDQSIQVEYAGRPLASRQQCFWKVKVWTLTSSAWSKPAFWSMGLLTPADWQAKWVKAGGDTSPWLRKEFSLAAAPERATAFVNVKGYGELYVNGRKVGDDVLSPAVAVYRKRTLYTTYDISKYLQPGTNCVGVWLGLGLCCTRKDQDYTPIARVQLDMLVGGQRVAVGTDTTWTWMNSSHTEFGWGWCGNGRENIDARRYIEGWSETGCTNGSWKPVEAFAEPSSVATAQSCPPNRITRKFPVVKCTAMTTNTFELDFGTNLNGWFTLRLPKLEAGHRVTIRFADKRLPSAEKEVAPDKTYELPPGTWKLKTANEPVAYTTYSQEMWVSDYGTGEFAKLGLAACMFKNNEEDRYMLMDLFLLPGQMLPEHWHLDGDKKPAKREGWLVRWGLSHIVGEGEPNLGKEVVIPKCHMNGDATTKHEVVAGPGTFVPLAKVWRFRVCGGISC
jgi:hypothetical protein